MSKILIVLILAMTQLKFDISNEKLFNRVYIPYLGTANRYEIYYGGRQRGGTRFVAQKILFYHNMTLPYSKVVLIRKVYNTIRDSQFAAIKSLIHQYKLEEYFDFRKSPLEIINKINGNTIICRGLDRPEKIKSLENPTCVWYEEGFEITQRDFDYVTRTLRGPRNSVLQELFTFNPENEMHWLNKRFFPEKITYEPKAGIDVFQFHRVKSVDERCLIIHGTYKDNEHLHKDVKRDFELLKELEPNAYRVDGLGLWGSGRTGQIYENISIVEVLPDNYDYRVFGLDFGYENPTALVECRVYDKKVYIKQLIYTKGLTDDKLIELMIDEKVPKNAIIFCDHELARIEVLRNKGWYNCQTANKSVNEGIQYLQSLDLNLESSSSDLCKEMTNYIWSKDKWGMPLDKPVKMNDHACDAVRYALFTYFILNLNQTKKTFILPSFNRFTKSDFFKEYTR